MPSRINTYTRLNSLLLTWVLLVPAFIVGCSQKSVHDEKTTLHVIHAGSLTLPVHEISRAFEREYPEVSILSEAWGSKTGARRVIDLENPADVFLSADYMVIENMLIPDHASWFLPFATNEMAIVYTDKSKFADEISTDNWMDILLLDNVKYGRSNPDHDPCGVRTVFTVKLAEKKYAREGFAKDILNKDRENIRPKETDLIALLEINQLDYIFLYKSVAVQHGLRFLKLPDSLSMGNFSLNDWYRQVQTTTLGTQPGETITEYGEAMVYGLTIPHKSENTEWARQFVKFITDPEKGGAILQKLGQGPVDHFDNPYESKLADFFKEKQNNQEQ